MTLKWMLIAKHKAGMPISVRLNVISTYNIHAHTLVILQTAASSLSKNPEVNTRSRNCQKVNNQTATCILMFLFLCVVEKSI